MSQLNDVTITEEKYKKLLVAMEVCKVLAKCWHYGDWVAETHNEMAMEVGMRSLGLYPFDDEDKMIEGTKIEKELYDLALKEINSLRRA